MNDEELKDERSFAGNGGTDSENNTPAEEAKSSISADLIRGHINTIILRTLDERDKYGYEIMNEIEEKSHGQYTLKQPTLYSALKRLENQGYIKAYWKTDEVSNGGRRKYFTLTELGREYSEKNQSEWEYSRTVIDSLISDRSFDFSQPAPTPVDFNLLKKSVSRVYTGGAREENEDGDEKNAQPSSAPADIQSEYAKKYDQIESSPVKNEYSGQTVVNELYVDGTKADKKENENAESLQTDQSGILSPGQAAMQNDVAVTETQSSSQPQNMPPYAQQNMPPFYGRADAAGAANYGYPGRQTDNCRENRLFADVSAPGYGSADTGCTPPAYDGQNFSAPHATGGMTKRDLFATQTTPEQPVDMRSEEEKRITHENFLRLISEQDERERGTVPNSQAIDTEKLIYTNRPETERDYKKLVNNIYNKTIKHSGRKAQQPAAEPQREQPSAQYAYYANPSDPTSEKAKADGLKVNTSAPTGSRGRGVRGTTFNKGMALFASSVIVGIILLIEFAVCLALMEPLHIGIMYPVTLLIIAVAEFGVFAVMYACGFGRGSIRPATHAYVSLCAVLSLICILVICLVSFLLDVNLRSATDIAVKIIIPSVTALNITVFGISYYFISK